MSFELQMAQFVQPMRQELTEIGFTELKTPDQVDEALKPAAGTALLFVNSICGCAAGRARPAVNMALRHAARPDHLLTVFAGQDKEATARAREYITGYPPSSPSMALFKDGQVVFMMERHQIENRHPQEIADDLVRALEQHCAE